MAWNSGFWNAIKNSNEEYDRKYNGDDYSEALSFVVGNGVVSKDSSNGLKVEKYSVSTSGYTVTIRPGQGWINGKWFKNDIDDNTSIANIPVTTAGRKRYDFIVIRRDNLISTGRTILPFVKKGEEITEGTPAEPSITRTDSVYELVIARILVDYTGSSPTISITDTRSNDKYCGWVNGYFGDNFNDLKAEATATVKAISDAWQDNTSVTKLVKYEKNLTVSAAGSSFKIGISQYSKETDELEVYTNGIRERTDAYTISDDGLTVTFNGSKTAGTSLVFVVWKSVDGTGVVDAVSTLTRVENKLAEIDENLNTYNYYCTGTDDNIAISNIIRTWLNEVTSNEYSSMRLNVHGTFGATTPFGGTGTSSDPYRWFETGGGATRSRKAIVDFTDCKEINIACGADTYNIIFYGLESNIIGANVVAIGGAGIYMFSLPTATIINAKDCRFWITATADASIARSGTFTNCRVSVTVTTADALCFEPTNSSLLRLYGGEYYAYTGQSNYTSAVIRIPATQTGAIALTYGINCPTVERNGYYQTHSIYVQSNSATCSFTDTITTLTMVGDGQNIRGTIALNRPGLM